MDTENKEQERAPFNMALDTLRSARNILDKISHFDFENTEEKTDLVIAGKLLYGKLSLVKSFFVTTSPLMDKKERDSFKEKLMKFKLRRAVFNYKTVVRGKYRKVYGWDYNSDIDNNLSNLLIEMQDHLQDKGHFMPPKSESDMF